MIPGIPFVLWYTESSVNRTWGSRGSYGFLLPVLSLTYTRHF
jgi:hypothetical protein